MKKLLAVLLAAIMSMTMLAGCEGGGDGATGGDVNVEATNASKSRMSTLITNTANQLMEETKAMNKNVYGFDVDEKKGAAGVEIEAAGLNIPVDGSFTLNSVKGVVQASADMDKEEIALKIDGEVNGVALKVLELLWDNNKIALASPEVINATFTLPTKDFTTKWNESSLGAMAPIDVEIPDLSVSSFFKAYDISLDMQAEILLNTVKFLEKSEGSEEDCELVLDGKSYDATKLEMVVTDENFKEYVGSFADVIKEMFKDDMFKNLMIAEMELTEEEYEAQIDEALTAFTEELDQIEFDDVVFYVYAYDNKIVKVEYEATIEEYDIAAYFQFNDPNRMFETMEFGIDATDGTEVVNVMFKASGNITSSTDDVLTYNLDVIGTENGEEMLNMNVGVTFDNKNNKYEANVDVVVENKTVAQLKAGGEYYKSSKECKLTFDSLTITADGETLTLTELLEEAFGSPVDLKIAVMIYPAKSISMTKTNKTYDITKMTQSDIMGFESELTENIQKIAQKLGISM